MDKCMSDRNYLAFIAAWLVAWGRPDTPDKMHTALNNYEYAVSRGIVFC